MRRRSVAEASMGAAFALVVFTGALELAKNLESPGDPVRAALLGQGSVEVSSFNSLEEMARASSLVISGSIEKVELSRQWVAVEEWGDDGIATYVALTVRVGEVLSGPPGKDWALRLEVFVGSPAAADAMVAAGAPTGRVLLFLDPRSDVKGAYKLVSSQGYFMEAGDAFAPAAASDAWIAEVTRRSFDAVVVDVKGIAASSGQ